MSRIIFVVLASLIALSSVVAAKSPERKAVVADTPEKFDLLMTAIQQEMAPGRRYEFLSSHNRQVVNQSLDQMDALLRSAGSVDAMSEEQKTRLFSIQEEVNGLLAKNADDRLVCSYSAPTGSHIRKTTCHTARELANSKAAAKSQFNDLTNQQNAANHRTWVGHTRDHPND